MQASFPVYRLFSAAVALVAVFGVVSFVSAWSGAPGNPPDGNVAAPINVSDNAQAKTGLLGLANLQFHPGGVPVHGITVGSVLTAIDDTGTVGWRPAGGSGGLPSCPQGAVLESVSDGQWACTYTRETNGRGSNPGRANPIYCLASDKVIRYKDTASGKNHGSYMVTASGARTENISSAKGCYAWEGPDNYGDQGCEVACQRPL